MIPPLAAALAERDAAGLYRRRRVVDGPGPRMRVDGRELVAFCSNDYLGLAAHPEVAAACADAVQQHGVGAGAAHLVCGHHVLHEELEHALAAFTGRARALVFSTGYMANLGIGTALTGRGALVVEDRLNHASLLDGSRAGGARVVRYAHGDAQAAAAKLADAGARDRFVFTDGVFSMDGDVAPLAELADACRTHSATLVVDDAHGLGVLGATGRGALEHCALSCADAPVLMGTLGKAFGVFGAFVAGSDEVIETLIQHARTYIYTTALPPALAAAALAALRVSDDESWRRRRVLELVARFRAGATARGISLLDSPTPIQPVPVGSAPAALARARHLESRGFLVTPIRPPTVPEGTARLRVTLSAAHEDAEVDALLDALAEAAE